jgi:hypothetical protein
MLLVIDIKVTLMSRNNGSSSMLAEFIKITDQSFEWAYGDRELLIKGDVQYTFVFNKQNSNQQS